MGGRLFKNRMLRLPLGNLAECFYDLWCAIAEVAQMALKLSEQLSYMDASVVIEIFSVFSAASSIDGRSLVSRHSLWHRYSRNGSSRLSSRSAPRYL